MTKQKSVDLGWIWAAAVACEERALSGEPWGEGDNVAEVLLTRIGDPKHLKNVMEDCDLEPLNLPQLFGAGGVAPIGARAWRFEAGRLWHQLGLDLRPDRWARPGRSVDVTPYHLHVETDPDRPFFQRRALDRPDPQLAASLLFVGRNLRPIVGVPGEAEDDYPTVIAGRGRTSAARLANREGLDRLVAALTLAERPLALPPPQILGLGGFGSTRPEIQALGDETAATAAKGHLATPDTILQLIGCLRVEIVDPDSALAHQAALVDNDGQRPETPMAAARQLRDMRKVFAELNGGRRMLTQDLAALKRVSSDTIANLEALLQLKPQLQDLVDAGDLSEAEAYRLARLPAARQMEVYEKSRSFSSVAERVAAIARLARGEQEALPETTQPRPPVPSRKQLGRAVERMRGLPLAPADSAQAGARAVLLLMAGHERALEGLPAEVVEEVRTLLADEPKSLAGPTIVVSREGPRTVAPKRGRRR